MMTSPAGMSELRWLKPALNERAGTSFTAKFRDVRLAATRQRCRDRSAGVPAPDISQPKRTQFVSLFSRAAAKSRVLTGLVRLEANFAKPVLGKAVTDHVSVSFIPPPINCT